MPRIFISYRRADTGDLCDRLATRLRWAFGEDAVFRDVNTILAGSSFPDALRQGVEACPVMLALIGPQWLAPAGNPPRRRIDDADDWVRAEIASALRLGHLVIPVLAPGAPELASASLPPDLHPLARFTSMPLRPDPVFDHDVAALTRAIRPYARQGPASWTLLIGGVMLALAYFAIVLNNYNPTPGYGILVEAGWVAQIALGGYATWRALARREWGWLAAGALTLLGGAAQFTAQNLPATTATDAYVVIELVVWPLAAGLTLLAGWIGPRLARTPDTLDRRWTAWHFTLAVLLSLNVSSVALTALLMVTLITGSFLLGVLYFVMIAVTALLTAATGVVASALAFTLRRVWRGVFALAIMAIAIAAALLPAVATATWEIVASFLLPSAFLIYIFVWLRSYDARTPAPSMSATPVKERSS